MRFRLGTLLLFITLFAVTVGMGYQVYLLKQQVTALEKQVASQEQRLFQGGGQFGIRRTGFDGFIGDIGPATQAPTPIRR